MAKDDYPVIVYQILAYLYQCLKRGEDMDARMISTDSDLFKANGQNINKRYWSYIIYNMQKENLINGVIFADFDGIKQPVPINWEDCQITPLGIEYLTNNSFLHKAKEFLKDTKAIVPFV